MEIRTISAELLKPADYNPRIDLQPDDPEWKNIEFSLDQYGLVVPIVFNERTGRIVSGHQRAKILISKGATEVECSIVDVDEETEKELNIALNYTNGKADSVKLEMLIAELQPARMEMLGFEDIIDANKQVDEDDYQIELPPEPKAKTGDIYQLGIHRLVCGDVTNQSHVDLLMNGDTVDLVITDPPYGVDYSAIEARRLAIGEKSCQKKNDRVKKQQLCGIDNDEKQGDTLYNFLDMSLGNIKVTLKDGGAFYLFHAQGENTLEFYSAMKKHFRIKQSLVWVKHHFALGLNDYHYIHEPIIYALKDGAKHWFIDDKTQASVFKQDSLDFNKMTKTQAISMLKNIVENYNQVSSVIYENKPERSDLHPTMKPIKLIGRLIKNSSKPGNIVLDPFGGSGSTLIACEQLGRRCCMIEIDPKYVDVIIDRWEKATNLKAVRI